MFGDRKDFRRWLYRFLPATHHGFYPARRRGLDHWATRDGCWSVAEAQRRFLLSWVGSPKAEFLELDAGDGVTGSHAVWLEEAGWRGASLEQRPAAAELLKKNRPGSFTPFSRLESISWNVADLVSARRDASIRRVLGKIGEGLWFRWVILQARDPQPEVFQAMNRAGYRLDHFIHDDEYYSWKGRGCKGSKDRP